MNQVQTYFRLNQYELAVEEIGLIFQVCLNYLTNQEVSKLNNHTLENIELIVGFKSRPPQPIYNPLKCIP